MKEDPKDEKTSRRQFTKAVITAAITVPAIVTVANCSGTQQSNNTQPPSNTPPTNKAARTGGPQKMECFETKGTVEEHIPPMGFDGGGGSLLLESANALSDRTTPFNYVEDGVSQPHDRYGELDEVRVITELIDPPYIRDVVYSGFSDGSKLLFWYQKIKAGECQYDFTTPYPTDPDVMIIGGHNGVRFFTLKTKSKLDARQPTFKCARPHRYRHPDSAMATSHFRIGRWRIVGPDDVTIFEDSVQNTTVPRPEYFRLYAGFRDFV